MEIKGGVQPSSIELAGYQIQGVSSAGVGTCITLPQLKVCFDTAQGLPYAYGMRHYLVTHGHQDHAGGIPYILSQKALNSEKLSKFYMPPDVVDPLSRIIDIWNGIEGYDCPYDFVGVQYEKSYPLQGDYFFKIFKTHHRVPSNGYTLFKRKKKLKKEFHNLKPQELVEKVKSGIEINEYSESPEISFTGDTKIEFLQTCPWVQSSRILIMEVTYCGEARSVERARQWGHTHWDEVLPLLDSLKSEHIVLIHWSRRHSRKEIEDIVYGSISKEQAKRIHIFS